MIFRHTLAYPIDKETSMKSLEVGELKCFLRNFHTANKHIPASYVHSLVKPHNNKGHWVTFDNFNSSYAFLVLMLAKGFHCVGTA